MRHLLARQILITCAAVVLVATRGRGQALDSVAPPFELKTLAGDTARLASLKGHPVLLNFWATWCTPCRGEIADIARAYQAHTDKGLQVLAINLTDQERMKDVRQFAAAAPMPFPILLDVKGKVRRSYRLTGVPTSVFIDSAGVVRYVHRGPIAPETIERGLSLILTH